MHASNSQWKGTIVWRVLFKGSKSEAEYPLIELEDGSMVRLYIKGADQEANANYLRSLENQAVSIEASWDQLRGFPRLMIDSISSIALVPPPQPGEE
jgi:hypothetical protein